MRIRANTKETRQSHSMSPKNVADTHSLQLAWIFRNLELFWHDVLGNEQVTKPSRPEKLTL